MIRAFVRSYGESSTETLSPGTIRMKCLRILPEICARTLRSPGRSTRNIVPGKTWVTVPSVMICSSFAIARRIYVPSHGAQGWCLRGAAVFSPLLSGDRLSCYTDKILCGTITGTLPAKALASIREAPHVSTTRRSGKAHPLLQIDSDKTVIECNVAVCQRMGYLRASRSRHANLGATGRCVRR